MEIKRSLIKEILHKLYRNIGLYENRDSKVCFYKEKSIKVEFYIKVFTFNDYNGIYKADTIILFHIKIYKNNFLLLELDIVDSAIYFNFIKNSNKEIINLFNNFIPNINKSKTLAKIMNLFQTKLPLIYLEKKKPKKLEECFYHWYIFWKKNGDYELKIYPEYLKFYKNKNIFEYAMKMTEYIPERYYLPQIREE